MYLSSDCSLTGSLAFNSHTETSDADFAVQEGSAMHQRLEGFVQERKATVEKRESYIGMFGCNHKNCIAVYSYEGNHFIICQNLMMHMIVQDQIKSHFRNFYGLNKYDRNSIWRLVYDLIEPQFPPLQDK